VTACSSANGLPIAGEAGAATSSDAGTAISAEAEAEAPIFDDGEASTSATVLDLNDVKTNPSNLPVVRLQAEHPEAHSRRGTGRPSTSRSSGTRSRRRGRIALHSKTESVYVIDGTQNGRQGSLSHWTVYFNPPGSGIRSRTARDSSFWRMQHPGLCEYQSDRRLHAHSDSIPPPPISPR